MLELLGSLGVFLFGMKIMSEGIQKVAGERMKKLLGTLTANRVVAVFTGLTITSIVQSSSATTVMVVSFVSAELMSLFQAIGVIMGANIGTTMTAWLVSLLGFKVKVSAFALPAVGVGLPLTFVGREKVRQWGEVLVGFGLLFLGLELLKNSVPTTSAEDLVWIAPLTRHGFGSVLIFVGLGTILTLVLQSSSATTTLTLTLAALGWIPFDLAAAMVLGENIGTTITANLAALGGSRAAKQAALFHFLFNVFGVIWALVLFRIYLLPFVDWAVPGNPYVDVAAIADPVAKAKAGAALPLHLAAFHTTFNITNTCLLLPFARHLERLVRRIAPDKARQTEPVVRYLSAALIETPELLLAQAGKEMEHMTGIVRRMFADAMRIVTHPDEKLGSLVEATLENERRIDKLEREITAHLARTTHASNSAENAREIAAKIQNVHRLERIGDHCAVLVRIARRSYDAKHRFREEEVRDLTALGDLVDAALVNLGRYLADETVGEAEELERRIDEMRRELRARHVERIQAAGSDVAMELAFLDVITHLEEIGDRATGIIRWAEEMRTAA